MGRIVQCAIFNLTFRFLSRSVRCAHGQASEMYRWYRPLAGVNVWCIGEICSLNAASALRKTPSGDAHLRIGSISLTKLYSLLYSKLGNALNY